MLGIAAMAESNRLKGVRTALTMTISFLFSILSTPSGFGPLPLWIFFLLRLYGGFIIRVLLWFYR
jgi:hypothetical protein